MTDEASRQTAWNARFTPEDVNLARRLYEAWRQAIVDWGNRTPPTWPEVFALGGVTPDEGPKPWLAVAQAASQPHAMCGRSLSGGELIDDQCRLRRRGHTCNRIVHGRDNMHYCSCLYSWPIGAADETCASLLEPQGNDVP